MFYLYVACGMLLLTLASTLFTESGKRTDGIHAGDWATMNAHTATHAACCRRPLLSFANQGLHLPFLRFLVRLGEDTRRSEIHVGLSRLVVLKLITARKMARTRQRSRKYGVSKLHPTARSSKSSTGIGTEHSLESCLSHVSGGALAVSFKRGPALSTSRLGMPSKSHGSEAGCLKAAPTDGCRGKLTFPDMPRI